MSESDQSHGPQKFIPNTAKNGSQEVYYLNHRRARQFPWSLYHQPLYRSLHRFLAKHTASPQKRSLLIIGPGGYPEIEDLKDYHLDISVVDIDPRVLEDIRTSVNMKPDSKVDQYYLDAQGDLSCVTKKFDLIYAKEVIEHVANPQAYLERLKNILNPGGALWLSTPDYGFFLLPFLESTFLELIARLSGYSRKDIHPSKLNRKILQELFSKLGFENYQVESSFAHLALCVTASRTNQEN